MCFANGSSGNLHHARIGSQFYKNIRTLLHVEIVNIEPCHDITYMSRYL